MTVDPGSSDRYADRAQHAAARRHTTVVDPQPVDYREQLTCSILLAPDVRAALHARDGEVIRISTSRERSVLCRVRESSNAPGAGSIRVDRFSRQALKAYPHEEVTLEVVDPAPADEVYLVPTAGPASVHDARLVPVLKRLLAEQRVAVRAGMILYVRLPHRSAGSTYDVHFVSGDEGYVANQSALWLIDADHEHGPGDHAHEHPHGGETVIDTTFEDIGGLSAQIKAVHEFVELPLIFPQVYRQLGISPPRGVVFHGAPGTGKTLLARSVANEVNAQLYRINGPEVVGTYSGETEANLRRIFSEASLNTPSIIMIDEIDAIAPARRRASSQSEARSVTQLLALMDGLERSEGVLVIATTNRIDAIDPAMRRAGRLDREVYFPTPAADARTEILRVHTREMPLAETAVNGLREIAERAHGFVGADLLELCREAGLSSLRRAAAQFLEQPSLSASPRSDDLVVRREDFDMALEAVRPAAMRGSLIEDPGVGWADIGGLDEVKKQLRGWATISLHHPDALARVGASANPGIMLYGPPGTGKTLLGRAIAREVQANFIQVQGPELFTQWLGESEESLRQVFDIARRSSPCVIFFDQIDAVAPVRNELGAGDMRASYRIVSQLLAALDELETRNRVIVIGATDRLASVDPAVFRPGRFGMRLHVAVPDADGRSDILRIHLRAAQLAEGLSLPSLIDYLTSRTDGFVGASLAFLCQNARLHAMQKNGFISEPRLGKDDFDAALDEL